MNYKYRMHDPRIGRFFAVDPMVGVYPYWSPYAFSGNVVISHAELEGLEPGMDIKVAVWDAQKAQVQALDAGATHSQSIKVYQSTFNASMPFGNLPDEAGYFVLGFFGAVAIIAIGPEVVLGWALKEGGEYVFESLTGLPWIDDPLDLIEYFSKRGVRGVTKDVAKQILKKSKNWRYNVKTFGAETAELYKRNKVSRNEARRRAGLACFIAGTKILTIDGAANIEDVKIGDSVWSYNVISGLTELKLVDLSFERDSIPLLFELIIENDTIRTTPEHPFYINNDWVKANEVKVGDTLTTFNTTEGHVVSKINVIDTFVVVYNFRVEDNHNYYVSDSKILVHNSDCYTHYDYHKHKAIKGMSEKDLIKSTNKGAARYMPEVDIKKLETEGLAKGTPVGPHGGSDYYVHDAGEVIGANKGKTTQYMRIEVDSNGNYHGHPISKSKYDEYIKKSKQ